MWGFIWLFWLVPVLIFASTMRRRRWRRWAMVGPGGYAPYAARWPRGRDYGAESPDRGGAPALPPELEDQRSYIDSLESRVAQLEERLDFTERLLSGRRETAPSQ